MTPAEISPWETGLLKFHFHHCDASMLIDFMDLAQRLSS